MALGPINRKPQERTTVRERQVANTAQYVDVDNEGRGLGAISKAFATFAGKQTEEQEQAELLKDREALDRLYLDIQRNPEAANAASRSGDWSAFSINERMNRPSIAKMMPTIAGETMGMSIAKDAQEAMKHLGPTDDAQAFLDGYIAKQTQGINNPTIERGVYDAVMKGTYKAVAQHKQFAAETFNAKARTQFRTSLNQGISEGASLDDLMSSVKLHASGMKGNLAENYQALKEQTVSQILWLSEGAEDETTRLAATALLAQENPEFGGSVLGSIDPVKRESILRQSRELAKSKDAAMSAEFYANLDAAITYAETSTEAQAAWDQAFSNAAAVGAKLTDEDALRLHDQIKAMRRREGVSSAIVRGDTVSPKDAREYVSGQLSNMASGKGFDVGGFIKGVANTAGDIGKENKGMIANILQSDSPQALEMLQAVTAFSAKNFTHIHNVDLTKLLPENSPVLPQVAFMLARDIKTPEDMKEAQVAWAEQMKTSFTNGVSTQNAARNLFKNKKWVESDENVVDEFLNDGDNRNNVAAHFGVDPATLEPDAMSTSMRAYLERRLNYAAAGASEYTGLTKEKFAAILPSFIGKPTLAEEIGSDGYRKQVPVATKQTVVNGKRQVATPPKVDLAHLEKTVGSGVGAKPQDDGSVSVTQPDFSGNDTPVVIPPQEAWIVPTPELAERLREGGRNVVERDGVLVADPLRADAPVGAKDNITEDGVMYFEKTEDGWEIRAKGAYLQQRPENEGFLMKAFRMLGWAPEVGTVDKPTITQLRERAELLGPEGMREAINQINLRRANRSLLPVEVNVVDDMLEAVDEEFMKYIPEPGTAGTPDEGPAAVDVQIEKRVTREGVAADVDAGRAHPDALHPNRQRRMMSTLENITKANPVSNYRSPGVASHIGESVASKDNNPAVLPEQKFKTPTEGIQATQDHFTKVWSEGARTIRAMLNGKTKMPDGAEGTPAGFVSKMWNTPQLHDVAKELGVKPEFIIAQAALESGWGKSIKGNALFGIKGKGQTFTTHEYIDGKKVVMEDSFRAYDSWGESIKDYGDLLKRRYAGTHGAKTGEEFFTGLKEGGYATDPKYVQSLTRVLESTHIQDAVRSMSEGDTPENEVSVVARNVGVDPDTPVDMNNPEVRTKMIQGVIEARQGTSEGRTWKPYVREVVEGRPAELPSTGTGDTVTGHGYRFDWPEAQNEMLGLDIRDINKITPEQHRILTATRIDNIMANYPKWLPGVTMDDTKRQALTEYLYHSPWNEELGRPAFLTQRLMHSLRNGKWDRVAREISRETRVFKQNLNGPQKDAARFLTKMQRQALADKFKR